MICGLAAALALSGCGRGIGASASARVGPVDAASDVAHTAAAAKTYVVKAVSYGPAGDPVPLSDVFLKVWDANSNEVREVEIRSGEKVTVVSRATPQVWIKRAGADAYEAAEMSLQPDDSVGSVVNVLCTFAK